MQTQTSQTTTETSTRSSNPEAALTDMIESIIAPLGYELVAIETQNHREKKLRVFIDLLNKPEGTGVGIEDCVRVTEALDQPLEGSPTVDAVFSGPYELEVSSPGVERPLRKTTDYNRFSGEIARIHTFRPLTAEETTVTEYSAKNPKQKNFYGIVRGYANETQAILFGVIPEDGTQKKQKGKKAQAEDKHSPKANEVLIQIPLELVSKANLEPVWED